MAASATNVMAACAAAAAVACGGAVIATNVPTADALRAFAPAAPPAAPTFPEAARLAKQGGFGPTIDLINHIQQTGVGGWLDEQFAATGSDYSDLAARVEKDNLNPQPKSGQQEYLENLVNRFV